jgi:PII-like signaling protein
MWCLRIRIKRNDEIRGKPLKKLLLNLFMDAKISDATIWTGIDGFGKRRRAATYLEGVLINMPLIIEVIDEQSKLEPLLLQLKEIIGGKGIITLQEVVVI